MTTDYNLMSEQFKKSKSQPWRSAVEAYSLMALVGDRRSYAHVAVRANRRSLSVVYECVLLQPVDRRCSFVARNAAIGAVLRPHSPARTLGRVRISNGQYGKRLPRRTRNSMGIAVRKGLAANVARPVDRHR
jgi:hypothetical protein